MRRAILAWSGHCGPEAAVAAVAARHDLRCVQSIEGLAVFAGEAIADRTMEDGALLLGDIYSLSGATCASPGDGWGNYLAFSQNGRTLNVVRAPLTGMPFYWARLDGGLLCFSDLELASGLISGLSLDWEFVAHSLSYANLRTERTGITGISELLPGMRLEFTGDAVAIGPTWSPWTHVAQENLLGVADLAPVLERKIIACTKAWCGRRGEILLELSGGLDSSIVAAALKAAEADFRAVNFVTPGADGDERHYARAVSSHCEAELIELPHDDNRIDLVASPSALQVRPAAYAVLGGIDEAFEAAFPEGRAAIFGGIGGDNVFGFDTSVAPILDAFGHFGVRRRSFEAMRDVARAGDATFWEAARLSYRALRAGPSGWRRETGFCDGAALPVAPLAHPWDEGEADAPRGKRNHVRALRRILDFVDRPRRWQDRDVVAPLLSQPVAELCLSIPSWTWVRGGRDRAVARAAFAQRLPPDVVWRRGKGRLDSLCTAAYLRQRGALADLLLGGRLAERGLLDRPAISSYLARDLVEGDFDYFRLLEIADAERWIRSIETSSFFGPRSRQR